MVVWSLGLQMFLQPRISIVYWLIKRVETFWLSILIDGITLSTHNVLFGWLFHHLVCLFRRLGNDGTLIVNDGHILLNYHIVHILVFKIYLIKRLMLISLINDLSVWNYLCRLKVCPCPLLRLIYLLLNSWLLYLICIGRLIIDRCFVNDISYIL